MLRAGSQHRVVHSIDVRYLVHGLRETHYVRETGGDGRRRHSNRRQDLFLLGLEVALRDQALVEHLLGRGEALSRVVPLHQRLRISFSSSSGTRVVPSGIPE